MSNVGYRTEHIVWFCIGFVARCDGCAQAHAQFHAAFLLHILAFAVSRAELRSGDELGGLRGYPTYSYLFLPSPIYSYLLLPSSYLLVLPSSYLVPTT